MSRQIDPIGTAARAIWGAAAIAYTVVAHAGCEVLAVVNAISGHRDNTGCVAFAPVDSLEARPQARST